MVIGGGLLQRLGRLSPRASNTGPIGLDIGLNAINLCQLRDASADTFEVVAKAIIPFTESRQTMLSEPKRLRQLLGNALKKGFSGNRVVSVLPPDELRITPVNYKSNVESVDAEILSMLAGRLEGEIADYTIDYLPVRSNPGDEESLALAAIARQQDVIDYLRCLEAAGLHTMALDIGPAALQRLICTLYKGEEAETILIVNVGLEKSYLTIISGRRLLFDQPVAFGERHLLGNLADTLDLSLDSSHKLVLQHGLFPGRRETMGAGGITEKEISQTLLEILKPAFIKLVEEINRVLIFTASETHGCPLSRIFLLGSIARWSGVEALLKELIDIPITSNQQEFAGIILDQTAAAERWHDLLPELAVATGLALRGMNCHA